VNSFDTAEIFMTVITPDESCGLTLQDAGELLRPYRCDIETKMLRLEAERHGLALAFAGRCLYCPGGKCARESGLSCLHPDKARASLESYGFDVTAISDELFATPILWGVNNKLPRYLTLVSALFYNKAL